MRKRIFALAVLVVMMLSISVHAMEPMSISAKPRLSFDGTTAMCSATCKGGNTDDVINATMTLYQGTTYVDSWSEVGTGLLYFSGKCKVKSGKEYKLVLEYSINREEQPDVYVTNKCP